MEKVKVLRVFQRGSVNCEWIFFPKFRQAIKRTPQGEQVVDYDKAFEICRKIVAHYFTSNEAKLHLEGDVSFFLAKKKGIKLKLKPRSF